MAQFLDTSSDPLWVFVIFLVALALFHYLLIYRYPLSLRQWKLVEYIWVGLALVSIYGIVEEARMYRAAITIEQSKREAMDKVAALENWFNVYTEHACDDMAQTQKARPFCRWVSDKNSDLKLILANEDFPMDVPINFLVGIEQPFEGIAKADREIVGALHASYISARQQYLMSAEDTVRSGLSALLVALGPMLFAVAIAIKFAKVTGEYRLCK